MSTAPPGGTTATLGGTAAADGAPSRGGLLERLVLFVAALREAGLPVSSAETLDAVRGAGLTWSTGPPDREALRAALAATLCKRAPHRPTFDRLFDLWWPAAVGEGVAAELAAAAGEHGGDEDAADVRARLRAELLEALAAGDDADLRRLAREAVAALGRSPSTPGRSAWFSYRVLGGLNPTTLTASLLERFLSEQDASPGGLHEQLARRRAADRLQAFSAAVEDEVRRRRVEESGPLDVGRSAVPPLLQQVDFLRATREEVAALRREVHPLARRLATRLTERRRQGARGPLDVRRTLRASLGTGGVPVVTHHRPPRPRKPELAVLCDVSGSVASFAQFTLLLAHALRDQFTRVRTFAFIDTCDEVTRWFFPGADVLESLARMSAEARLVRRDGHSDYGHAFLTFAREHADAVGPSTSLLVLGDARNNYRATHVRELAALTARARHSYWLNPEPRAHWGSGDSVAGTYAAVVDEMVECRTPAQLSDFVERLLPT